MADLDTTFDEFREAIRNDTADIEATMRAGFRRQRRIVTIAAVAVAALSIAAQLIF